MVIITFILCAHVCTQMPRDVWMSGSCQWSSPSTVWVPRIELRLSVRPVHKFLFLLSRLSSLKSKSLCLCLFETRCYVAQVSLKLAMYPRLASNLESFFLALLNGKIVGMCQQTQAFAQVLPSSHTFCLLIFLKLHFRPFCCSVIGISFKI